MKKIKHQFINPYQSEIARMSSSHPISVVILYYAGVHEDDEDTLQNVKGIEKALKKRGYGVKKVVVTKKNWLKTIKTPGDVVFNFVEDDTWQLYVKVGLRLEKLERAQVGHDMKCFRYAIRKAWIKRRLKKLKMSTPNFKIFNRKSNISKLNDLSYPLIVKPSCQHAGIGISQDSVVTDKDALVKQVNYVLANYPGEVIVEEFVKGREIHVTILGNGDRITVLPYCEIGFGGKFKSNWSVYTYEAKWDKKSWEYWDARVDSPVNVSPTLDKKIKKLAVAAYHVFGCRDVARMDIRVDAKDRPFLVDVNMNPSLNYYDEQDATLASVYALGWSYDQFVETIIAITYERVYGS